MQKADIILSSPRTASLSPIAFFYRLLLKSRYVHSMLYLGEGKIIHTTSRHGVVIASLPKKIFRRDRYSVFRVKSLSPVKQEKVVKEALKWKQKKLDYAGLITNIPARLFGMKKAILSWKANRIWCSKLIYKSFLTMGIDLIPGKETEDITSEDIASSPLIERI
jgi:hypothetical protein